MQTKETRNVQIKVRISATEKEKIDCYCKDNKITISEFLRKAIYKLFEEENNRNEIL